MTQPQSQEIKCLQRDMIVSFFAPLSVFTILSCLLVFFFPPPAFSVRADFPAVGSRHIPQSVSLLIPGPDLKGSLKDESLYTMPDFVK